MKKFLLLPLLLFTPLFALPLGNPVDASLYCNSFFSDDCYTDPCDPCYNLWNSWNFRVGFYGDYVFNRHMQLSTGTRADIDDFEIYTNAGYLALNLFNRFDVFGTLGTTNIKMGANPKNLGLAVPSRLYLDTNAAFSWSVGGRLTLWDWDCFYFGLEGQYFSTRPNVDLLEIDGFTLVYPDNSTQLKYTEWQVGLGISYVYRVACSGISLVPYTGVKWACAKANFDNATPTIGITLFNQKNNKLWGWALGTTLLFNDAATLSVEGRWGDEKAVYVNGQIRF